MLRIIDTATITDAEDGIEIVGEQDEAGIFETAIHGNVITRTIADIGFSVGENCHSCEPLHPLVKVD